MGGAISVHSDLLCGQTEQIWPLKKPLVSTTDVDPPYRFHQNLPHRYSCSLMPAARVPPCSLPPAPTRAQGLHLQPVQTSVAMQMQNSSLDSHRGTHRCAYAWESPSRYVLVCCLPDTCHQPPLLGAHLGGDCAATGWHADSQGPCNCNGPRSGRFLSWPALPCSPAASPSSCVPEWPWPNPHHRPPVQGLAVEGQLCSHK